MPGIRVRAPPPHRRAASPRSGLLHGSRLHRNVPGSTRTCAARYVDGMANAEPDLHAVLGALAALSLRGHRSSSLDDVADELAMPAPYTEPLQRLLQTAERDGLVRAVEHDDIGDPYYVLTEDDERRGDA